MSSFIFRLPHVFVYYTYRLFFPSRFANQQKRREKPASKNENSLQGFDKHKCIFVHIPKAAGVSLAINLFGDLGGGHTPIYHYYLVYSPKEFNEFFKFTIVRNPWDRLVSAYFFLKQGGFNGTDKQWFQENLSQFETFDEFVKNWLSESSAWDFVHFIPQYYFIMANRKILVDQVYKFEHMDKTLMDLGERLSLRLYNTHKNKTHLRDSDYRKYYTAESKRIVEHVYRKDIQLFGYSF